MFDRILAVIQINSLKGRLRFWFILLIVLLISLCGLFFVTNGKSMRIKEANDSIEQMINLQQLVVENWFAERMETVLSISNLPSVRLNDLKPMKEALETMDQNHLEFTGMVFVNGEGITEIDTEGPVGIDLSDRDYFKEAKKGHTYITDVLIGRQSNSQIMIISAPVFDNQQKFKGLIFGAVRLDTLNKVMGQFRNKPTGDTYLVNTKGVLITESRQGAVGETIPSTILKQALEGNTIKQKYADVHGENVFGDYRWVNDRKWLIIGETTESEILYPFHRMAIVFSIASLFVILIGLILMIWLSNHIESPIRNVLEGARKIGEGKYDYRLDPNSYKNDAIELRELCMKFNSMASLIQAHIHSIGQSEERYRQLAEELRESEERFRLIAEYSSDMITLHDQSGAYLYVSPAGKDILKYENEEMIGKDSRSFIHQDDQEIYFTKRQTLLNEGYLVFTYRIKPKYGEYIWIESSVRSLQGKNPGDPRLIVVSRNINERKMVEQRLEEANETLKKLSMKDGLTGVGNRRSFDENLGIEWNRALRGSNQLTLIMLDIDYFKAYNDTYGHQQGDDCLKGVAVTIQNTIKRAGDVVFRYGGEEFAVLLPETDMAGAKRVGENIRLAINTLKIPHSASLICDHITISSGIATVVPKESNHLKTLIEAADKALYQAKADGRNRICCNNG